MWALIGLLGAGCAAPFVSADAPIVKVILSEFDGAGRSPEVTQEPGGFSKIGTKRYRGKIAVEKLADGSFRAVNHVGLEDYLRGVVGGEMPADSPAEALGAQAVAARSYVLGEIARGKPVFDSVASQVYRGREAEDPRTDAAVARTEGLVLRYQEEIFLAYFHSTCGGHTGDPLPTLGEPACPPLRGIPCGYCSEKGSKYFRWETEVPFPILDEIVAGQRLGSRIQSLGPGSKDPWGRWMSVRLVGNQKEGTMRGDLFRAEVNARLRDAGNLRSLLITGFEARENAFRFSGGGWGHGVGMCQVGAIEMARLGFSYEQILARYYPGARLEPLELRKN